MTTWDNCKNILVIRPDNMGDLLMSGPAIRALKQSFDCKITVLTSSVAAQIASFMPEIDDVIIFDVPWVKTSKVVNHDSISKTISLIKEQHFNAAVIFTVYSQNPLPSAMLAYMAGIPNILAYCRENPYELINNWVPDEEPYTFIRHQVRRDLDLVKAIGATTPNEDLELAVDHNLWGNMAQKLSFNGFKVDQRWIILHAGVSERKRAYPFEQWVDIARKLITINGYQVLFTGSGSERALTDQLTLATGDGSFSTAGLFNIEEFICLVSKASAVISVNTGTIHIAAAVKTPTLVLYAQSNPQHTPWNVTNAVLPYSVCDEMKSRNEVIAHVNELLYSRPILPPSPQDVVDTLAQLIRSSHGSSHLFPGTPHQNQVFPAS